MRYLKMLSLAAVAVAALMAVVGAGAAQAESTFCRGTEDPCSVANMYPVKTVIAAWTIGQATLSTGFATVTCFGTLSAKIESLTTPEGTITALGWTACGGAEEVASEPTGGSLGTLTVRWDAEHNGNLTMSGVKIRIKALGVTCVYGGNITSGLTLKGGNPATVGVNAGMERLAGSSVLCGKPGGWSANYEVTAPKPLYVAKGL
jgi:hypothetical protein